MNWLVMTIHAVHFYNLEYLTYLMCFRLLYDIILLYNSFIKYYDFLWIEIFE